ncbi:10149_t:CDS:2, partial [Diversispora eburnea]
MLNAIFATIRYNETTTLIWYNNKTFTHKGVCMYLNIDAIFSVVRFTAPMNGNYSLDVTFTHVDDNATTRHTGSIDSGVAVRPSISLAVASDNLFNNKMTLVRVDIRLLGTNSTTESSINTNPANSTYGNKVGIIIGTLGASLTVILRKSSPIRQFTSLRELYMEDCEELSNLDCLIFASLFTQLTILNHFTKITELTLLNLSLEQIIAGGIVKEEEGRNKTITIKPTVQAVQAKLFTLM